MQAEPRFASQSQTFWAYVRTITEALGSSVPRSGVISAFTPADMHRAMARLGRSTEALGSVHDPSDLALLLEDYFAYRAAVLNQQVKSDLMVTAEASELFDGVVEATGAILLGPVMKAGKQIAVDYLVHGDTVRVPMNKQTGEMRQPSFLTGIVNLVVADALGGRPCDYDPRALPVIDFEGTLYAAMSRRMDGSMPATVNPLAMWEIKEYYYTTTFGSKISDAVYITALDGYERAEVEAVTGVPIDHLIIVDAYDTWWVKGKSYLCRLVDLVNMGKVTHLICGREAVRELPLLAAEWAARWDDQEQQHG
ncbi:Protein of unknown function [Propionibacterium freudenreichii]|nr:Protein of unknown function [Propionibacterium freudenreichii]